MTREVLWLCYSAFNGWVSKININDCLKLNYDAIWLVSIIETANAHEITQITLNSLRLIAFRDFVAASQALQH